MRSGERTLIHTIKENGNRLGTRCEQTHCLERHRRKNGREEDDQDR